MNEGRVLNWKVFTIAVLLASEVLIKEMCAKKLFLILRKAISARKF